MQQANQDTTILIANNQLLFLSDIKTSSLKFLFNIFKNPIRNLNINTNYSYL